MTASADGKSKAIPIRIVFLSIRQFFLFFKGSFGKDVRTSGKIEQEADPTT
jgi:hypothetical protein